MILVKAEWYRMVCLVVELKEQRPAAEGAAPPNVLRVSFMGVSVMPRAGMR